MQNAVPNWVSADRDLEAIISEMESIPPKLARQNRRGFIRVGDGFVNPAQVCRGKRLPQIIQRLFELPHLLRQGLQRHGRRR